MPLRGKVRAAPQASIQCRAFCCFICFHCPVYAAYSPFCNSFTYAAAHGCVREPNIPSRIPAGTQYRSWKFRFSGFQVDGRTGFGGRGACGWADAPPPKSKDQSLFPLRTAPPSPRISPKHMDGRQARASVPIPPSPPPCRRLPARSPHPNRNAAHPPTARGAWAREYGANGAGRRHCRPAPTQESRPLGIPFSGNASVFPISPSPKTPQAAGPCSWACCRVCALPPEQKRNEASPPPCSWGGLA